jgi:hypothetical protein
MADMHALLVYSLNEQTLLTRQEFSSEQQDDAFAAYTTAEAEHRGLGDVDLVLVAADYLDTIRHTHSSYFRDEADRMNLALDNHVWCSNTYHMVSITTPPAP